MENNIKENKKVKATLKKLELNVNEYAHYDGKINKEVVESKAGTNIYNYKDILKLMENNREPK